MTQKELENITITSVSVKRIFEYRFLGFKIKFYIPALLWYPSWSNKSKWTIKK